MPVGDPTMPTVDPNMPVGRFSYACRRFNYACRRFNYVTSDIKPATDTELQSKPQEENKLPEKVICEQILEDLIKTQIELFMKTSDEEKKENFLQKLNLRLAADVDNTDKIYDEYIQVKIINDMTLKTLIMNLFLDKNGRLENLEILFNYINKGG